tara:strand:+ start:213 stop:1379 length:1167 start_codon:yes stop_codon:yes gene_type:complete
MKKIIILLFSLCFSYNSFSQTDVFYSIDDTGNLVYIDTLGSVTIIGPTSTGIAWGGLVFNGGSLYLSQQDSLYIVNIMTGYASSLFLVVDTVDGQSLSGDMAVDQSGQLYLFNELTAFAEGRLYTVDINSGIATRLSNSTSGNASIIGIEFDKTNNILYGASELSDKLLTFDLSTGVVDSLYPNPLGMNYTTAMTYMGNDLWGIDFHSFSTPYTTFCKINTSTGIADTMFILQDKYFTLARSEALCLYYDTLTTMVYDTTFIYDTLTTIVYDTTFITAIDTNLISVTDTLFINLVLSSIPSPNNLNTIRVFPNPANDHITIDNGNYNNMGGYSLEIKDFLGQNVFQSIINQQSFYINLNTNFTGMGVYFISIIDPNNNVVDTRKIILQ